MSWLTTRIARIGNIFQSLKKLVIRDGVISSNETLKTKYLQKGVGAAAMTSIFAFLKERGKHESKTPGDVIRNLEEIVEQRACYFYNAAHGFYFKRTRPSMKLDWSEVEFIPDTPKYKKNANGVDGFRVTSKTNVQNKSTIDLEHTLKSERQTSSVCESHLTEGFTIGPVVGLSLLAPEGMGIAAEFTLQRVTGNTDKKKYAWLVEECIKIPGQSNISVSMILKEKELDYSFTTRIGVKGKVTVTYYNEKDEEIGEYRIPMSTIINEEFPERMTEMKDGIPYIKISGKCKFQYEADDIVIT